MSIQTEYNPWEGIELSPQEIESNYDGRTEKSPWDEIEFGESFLKSAVRTAYQPISAFLNTTVPGIITNFWNLLGAGEAFDPEAIEELKKISEREGVPFDEQEYLNAAHAALDILPTISNAERFIEEKTGLPLAPKTRLQKGIKTFFEASRLAPSGASLRPSNIPFTKPILGAGVEATKEALIEMGLPETIAEPLAYGVLGPSKGGGVVGPSLGETKPSGMTKRGFEMLEKPREVSAKRLEKINEKVESDFRNISDQIISESPVGETFENLKNDPTFKQESRELLNEAQNIADNSPGIYPTYLIKKELADISSGPKKGGYVASDYEKAYSKYIKEMIDEIPKGYFRPGQWVEQYRKNNAALTEYFEPGSSKAVNRAKRDALLDHNLAIAKMMEKVIPESELIPVFKEGNERWTKIMDTEAVDGFIDDIFSGKKINYKDIHKYFDKEGYSRIFKRSLGEKGFKDFENLLKDMLTTEAPYKMLKVAEQKGFGELAATASTYLIHPTLGKATTLYKAGKEGFKWAMNALLDKPSIAVTWKKGIDNLKKGNFTEATKNFNELKSEIELPEQKLLTGKEKAPTIIEIQPEKIKK